MDLEEVVRSVGIDIGTSTTQLVFSRIVIVNLAGTSAVPRIGIVDKEVTYRSDIHFTPLKSATEIDAEAVLAIVRREYERAGVTPADLQTGAIIITGDTARKENANQVLSAMSSMAGDFVVATAGPDLESVLSGRGAGADKHSEERREAVVNIDIGGGTSNFALFQRGQVRGVSCMDIGGRLIKIQNGKMTYIFPKIRELAKKQGISLVEGAIADKKVLEAVCSLMADQLAQAIYLQPMDGEHLGLYTNDGKPLPDSPPIGGVTFSGGVADYVYGGAGETDPFKYGDIGILLGRAVANHPAFGKTELLPAAETIRATVVGAGTHTTEVSGSTITYAKDILPLKNIPILKVSKEDESSLETMQSSMINQMSLYRADGRLEQIAIGFAGHSRLGFAQVQALAKAIIEGAKEAIACPHPLIIVVEADIGKVLGNAINVLLEHKKPVICIDSIPTGSGDYIDIGEPLVAGHVVPVVIKTLIFNT